MREKCQDRLRSHVCWYVLPQAKRVKHRLCCFLTWELHLMNTSKKTTAKPVTSATAHGDHLSNPLRVGLKPLQTRTDLRKQPLLSHTVFFLLFRRLCARTCLSGDHFLIVPYVADDTGLTLYENCAGLRVWTLRLGAAWSKITDQRTEHQLHCLKQHLA